jgi:predicted O-methyltransferase YrrM
MTKNISLGWSERSSIPLRPFIKAWNRVALHRLSQLSSSGRTLSCAIRNAKRIRSAPFAKRIEAKRKEFLKDNSALVDNTLGPPGIYDEGTIAEACYKSKAPDAAQLLYALVYAFGPETVIELGTNLGISSAYLAAGLKDSCSGGRVLTLESSPYRLRLAQVLHQQLGLDNISYKQGLFIDTLVSSLEEAGPVGMAFVDGHHQYQPTLDYFDSIWSRSIDDCVFIFDDIRWSEEMKRAWNDLRRDSRVTIAVDLRSIGICITAKTTSGRSYRTLLMPYA